MRELPVALAAFGAYKQFVIYKSVPSESRPGKTDKLPIDHSTGRLADAHNSSTWLTFERASEIANSWGSPFSVGFVFTENDPFWFLDIDDCLLESGWAPHALQVCQLLTGCAIEVSPSGKGLHLFGSGKPPAHSCKNSALKMEFYHTARFSTLTGINAQGDCARDFTNVLPTLVGMYFPPDASQKTNEVWSELPVPEWDGIKDDAELIRRAIASHAAASTFGDKASFADLWFADEKALGRAFPDPIRSYDASGADSSLAQHLAFWTGKDCERIRRLMFQSKLVRDKWEREDYLVRTIIGVVSRQIDVFQAAKVRVSPQSLPESSDASQPNAATLTEGSRILNLDCQRELFGGIVYITDSHRVLIRGGHILKPDQFRVHFGGYSFQMDIANDRLCRDSWKHSVNLKCFDPRWSTVPAFVPISTRDRLSRETGRHS